LRCRRARKFKFALKIIDKASCRDKEQQIKNEVSLLRRLRHGNIVQLIEDFDTADRLYMVMELVTVRPVYTCVDNAVSGLTVQQQFETIADTWVGFIVVCLIGK